MTSRAIFLFRNDLRLTDHPGLVAAVKAFSAGMEDRVQNALSQKYDEVSQTVFNQTDSVETEIEDNTDLETEMEDNDV